jgi:simple sugar transport system substrate-binding protein
MKILLGSISAVALLAAGSTGVFAQSIDKAVGGYSWEDAAKESPDTKNFHSADGHLTFAIVTHTAGNGFFDPVYVGAQVAADAFGINLIKLGSEAAVDDIPREIEILNQIIQDPTIDGLILTTPQAGAYDDIVKHMLDQGIPVATTNSFDPTIYDRNGISHTGQSASAAAIGGEALADCVIKSGKTSGSIIFPSQTTAGNVEVNQRVTFAFNAVTAALDKAGVLANFTVDAGPENIGIPVNDNDIAGSITTYIESRGDVVGVFGPNGAVTPAIVDAVTQAGKQNDICAFGYDLGHNLQEGLKSVALTGLIC